MRMMRTVGLVLVWCLFASPSWAEDTEEDFIEWSEPNTEFVIGDDSKNELLYRLVCDRPKGIAILTDPHTNELLWQETRPGKRCEW